VSGEDFFAAAHLNPRASSITGAICGVRIKEIDNPLQQKIRYLVRKRWGRNRRSEVQKARRAGWFCT